ncbi:MAG: transcriptional repressor [Deltaproteobacteria bacterium]|nr:transcriptional repressor [Deltaproteobacteria bacterium]
MVQLHRQEKDQFKKLFKQEAVDHFDDRLKVLEIFLNSEHHVTAGELVSLIEQNGHTLSPDFVLETLKLMCRFGFAQKNRFEDGHIRYEHMHLGEHHDHMICTRCNAIVEFQNDELEVLQLKIASGFGFHTLQHKMELYGICARCMKDHAQLMSLTQANQGERVKVKEFIGGSESRMRLLSMGLRIGDEVQVITNIGKGQMAIAVDFKRFVIGRGLAQKIMVLPIQEENAC